MLLKRSLRFFKKRPISNPLRLFSSSGGKHDKFDLDPEICYYKTLNISTNAKFEDVKSAYLELAKKHHPDISAQATAKEKFQAISMAYKVLSKPENRLKYDYSIGIKNPSWQMESEVVDEFENQELFMKYVKGERDYDSEKDNIDYSYEENNSEKLYDYFRYKYLGRFRENKKGQVKPLSPFRDMADDANLTDNTDPMQFSMKTDKKMRAIRKERKEKDVRYFLFVDFFWKFPFGKFQGPDLLTKYPLGVHPVRQQHP